MPDILVRACPGFALLVNVALIANLASGSGFDPAPAVRAMEALGAAVRLGAPDERPDRLVVAGGDGTVAEIAALAGRLDVPLGVIPAGTANDFARANDLPLDVEEAAVLAVTGTRLRRLDLGRLGDGTPFVNVAGAGLGPVAARNAAPLKPRLGALAYAIGAVRAAAGADPLSGSVRADGVTVHDGPAWQVIVAVTGALGGGSALGAADPQDGALDVAVLPAGSRLGLARRAWGLKRGTIAEQHDVAHHRAAVVEVALPPGTELNVDGELRTTGLERVTLDRAAFALVT